MERSVMSPTRRRTFALLTLAGTLGAGITGCSSTPAPTEVSADCLAGDSLTLVVPVHQGAPAPAVPREWDCAMDAAIRGGLPISVVTSEGEPRVLVRSSVAEVRTDNDLVAKDDVTRAKNELILAITAASAESDGNDLLAALALAGDLSPAGQVMSLDNGITDTGALRTVEEGMSTSIDAVDVAQNVQDNGACPTLTGVHVELYSLGYQVAPGEAISQRQRTRVTEIWSTTLQACGATTTVVSLPRTGQGPDTTHASRTLPAEPDPQMPSAQPAPEACEAVLPDSAVGFVTNRATFLDPDRAREVVSDVAAALAACPGAIEIIGTTSSAGTIEDRADLSMQRATAVGQLLGEVLGTPIESMRLRGLGYDEAEGGCIPDVVNGVLDPVLAAQNRKVVIRVVT